MEASFASATLGAWSPTNRKLLAVGTHAADPSPGAPAQLQVLGLDYQKGGELVPAGSPVPLSAPLHSLAWGKSDAGGFEHGVLAGALGQSSVALWSAGALLGGAPGGRPGGAPAPSARPLASIPQASPVRVVAFSPLQPATLGLAPAAGGVATADLTAPGGPRITLSLEEKGADPASRSEETGALAWNNKAAQIVATARGGVVRMWDTRSRKERLHVDTRRQTSAVAWHPLNDSFFVTASREDNSPILQLWSLRKLDGGPVQELLGHHQGILDAAWCPHDPAFLLSVGKDARALLWDTKTGNPLGELAAPQGAGFSAAWAPANPGAFLQAARGGPEGQAGTVSVHSFGDFVPLEGGAPLGGRAPRWLGRPTAATLGFGGRLAALHHAPDEQGAVHASVTVRQVVTEAEVVTAAGDFDAAICAGDASAAAAFCAGRAAAAHDATDAETWAFLRLAFEPDPRQQLLVHLGFEEALPKAEVAPEGPPDLASLSLGTRSAGASPRGVKGVPPGALPDANGISALSEDPDQSFFDNEDAGTPTAGGAPGGGGAADGPPGAAPRGGPVASPRGSAQEAEAGQGEAEIQTALIARNYRGAFEACLHADRLAEALVIAHLGGPALHEAALRAVLERRPRPALLLAARLRERDFLGLVKGRPLGRWRETLALLAAHAGGGDEFPDLAEALGRRLASAKELQAATLVYVCAGRVEAAVKQWLQGLRGQQGRAQSLALQGATERGVMLELGARPPASSPSLARLVSDYATLLAAQGQLAAALDVLALVPTDAGGEAPAVLRDRLFRAAGPAAAAAGAVPTPPFPFVAEDVAVPPAPAPAYGGGQSYGGGGYGSAAGYGQRDAHSAAYGQPQQAQQAQQQRPASGFRQAPAFGQQQAYGQQPAYGAPEPPYGSQQGFGAASQGFGGAGQGFGGGGGGVAPPPVPGAGSLPPGAYGGASSAAAFTPQQPASAPSYDYGYGRAQAAPPPPTFGGASLSQRGSAGGAAPPPVKAPAPSGSHFQPHQPQGAAASPAFGGPHGGPPGGFGTAAAAPPPPPPSFGAAQHAPAAPSWQPQQQQAKPAGGWQGGAQAGLAPSLSASSAAMPVAAQQAPAPARFGAVAGPPQAAPSFATFQPSQGPAQQQGGGGFGAPPGGGPPAYGAPQQYQGAGGPPPGGVPQSPPAPAAPPPPPLGPPADISVPSADVSKVAPELQPVVRALAQLYSTCEQHAKAGKRAEMRDTSKKVGTLFWQLNKGDVEPRVAGQLLQLAQALEAGNLDGAAQVHLALNSSDWDTCKDWLMALKRLLKMRRELMQMGI